MHAPDALTDGDSENIVLPLHLSVTGRGISETDIDLISSFKPSAEKKDEEYL